MHYNTVFLVNYDVRSRFKPSAVLNVRVYTWPRSCSWSSISVSSIVIMCKIVTTVLPNTFLKREHGRDHGHGISPSIREDGRDHGRDLSLPRREDGLVRGRDHGCGLPSYIGENGPVHGRDRGRGPASYIRENVGGHGRDKRIKRTPPPPLRTCGTEGVIPGPFS